MTRYEQLEWFREELEIVAGRDVSPQEKVRFTRTIVVEGTAEWVQDTAARCYVPEMGTSKGIAGFGTVRCTDHKIEVMD